MRKPVVNAWIVRAVVSFTVLVSPLGARAQGTPPIPPTLDKGHRLLLERGLQIHAVTLPTYNDGYFSMRDFRLGNFTSINMGHDGSYHPEWYGQPGDYFAGVVQSYKTQSLNPARAIAPYLVSLQYLDEQNLADPAERADTKRWFEAARADPAFNNTILYTNQFGFQIEEQHLRTYMAESKPDMVMMDEYLIGSASPMYYSHGSPTGVYQAMVKYRRLGLAGNDGTGRQPIPYGKYVQSFSVRTQANPESVRVGYRLSESDVRLDQFSAWAMGYTFAAAFTFDSMQRAYEPFGSLMFDGEGVRPLRTTEFRYFAETNRQSRNLGPTLVRLKSTDIRMLTGPLSNPNHTIPEWNPAADPDPYITSLSAVNPGTVNGGARGDVLVGFFEPLPGLGGPDPSDLRYFMVVNGLSGEFASATDAAQLIRIDFEFGATGIHSLQRVSRDTGLLEEVPLISDGGSRYHLRLLIPGGTGELFRYKVGGAAAVPEPAAAAMGLLVAVGLLKRRR